MQFLDGPPTEAAPQCFPAGRLPVLLESQDFFTLFLICSINAFLVFFETSPSPSSLSFHVQ